MQFNTKMSKSQQNKPAVAHFNYDDLDNCSCALCTSARDAEDYYSDRRANSRGHALDCKCFICKQKREAMTERLAATAKRETYSELSFLTCEHRLGPQFLEWVYDNISNPKYRSNEWWASHGYYRMLQEWMTEWQIIHLPKAVWGVSGLY